MTKDNQMIYLSIHGIKDGKETGYGLSPKARGIILHRILELFWQEVKTQACLKALSKIDKEEKINRHIEQAFSELPTFTYEILGVDFIML